MSPLLGGFSMNSASHPFPPSEEPTPSEVPPAESAPPASPEAATHEESTREASQQTEELPLRWHPIPPPAQKMQYRAIGLLKGKYTPSADQFNQGILLTEDGTIIDAVLLGRIMSLLKKHLSLEEEHLWVVYPRPRQKEGNLHAQIVGVWEPEKLTQNRMPASATTTTSSSLPIEDGFFSIRGEVVYQSEADQRIIVKIRQSPRKKEKKPRFFKLSLAGTLEGKAVGHFWDLQVRRQSNELVIHAGEDMGTIPKRKSKKPSKKKSQRPQRQQKPVRKNRSQPAKPAPPKKRQASENPSKEQPPSNHPQDR
jgi:hypothetical protein